MDQCPSCGSPYPDIHMMCYPDFSALGTRCENDWHRGPSYDPSVIRWTAEDRALLKEHHISPV
jgi:hypothetical protein